MDINEYQKQASSTNIYPHGPVGLYAEVMGLCGEAGEVADKVKKIIRDSNGDVLGKQYEVMQELGDVLWYTSQIADRLGFDLDVVARANLSKLSDRMRRNVIGGSGDER